MSRRCQEFGLPIVAGGALDQPDDLMLTIIEMRAYATTKELIDRATKDEYAPTGYIADLVMEFYARQAREVQEARATRRPSSR